MTDAPDPVAYPETSLQTAQKQVARLEQTVAELLFKNEHLRQQVQVFLSQSPQTAASAFPQPACKSQPARLAK